MPSERGEVAYWVLLALCIAFFATIIFIKANRTTESPAPPVIISEEEEVFGTFGLLLEAVELCHGADFCNADDDVGARLNPETGERTCLCPDGTTPPLP